jgi:putative ABC transport system substrate-binding protein
MRRRAFISLVGSAAAWPLAARAQQSAMPTIGFLSAIPPNDNFLAAFRRGLSETGYVEGQNLAVEYRWVETSYDQLPELASDLVRRQVLVIVATGGSPSAVAARALTTTIPIVFTGIDDPVASGFVTSLSRPGGNMTGMSVFNKDIGGKRFELLREMLPKAKNIAVLMNPDYPAGVIELADIEKVARASARELAVYTARNESDIAAAFAMLNQRRPDALFVGADPFFNSRRRQLVALASRYSIPASYCWREYIPIGGLMSYGTSFAEGYYQGGIYAGRILKGEKPANLPVVQPTKFEFVINLKTAKALGIEVPPNLLALADEVIE